MKKFIKLFEPVDETYANTMWTLANVLLSGLVVVVAQGEVKLEADQPYQKVRLHDPANLKCCYSSNDSVTVSWFKLASRNITLSHQIVNSSSSGSSKEDGIQCQNFRLESAHLSDSGLYRCFLNDSETGIFSHGTFLHVYKPLQKTLNFSEKTKNRILTAEGILLLLCVLLPATTILCQRNRQNELEKKKVTKETENIYQGLNLDDCSPKYDQIERSQKRGPYQDVCNPSQADDFQLEKP